MASKEQSIKGKAVLMDFLELSANAFASGLMVAIVLAALTLVLSTN